MTEDEMVGWHHRLEGHEFGQALGIGDGQGSLSICSIYIPCGACWHAAVHGVAESDMTK